MIEKTCRGLPMLFFERLAGCPELLHGVTTRSRGVSPPPFASLNLGLTTDDSPANVLANHRAAAFALDVDLGDVVSARQVHGTRILHVRRRPDPAPDSALLRAADGFDSLMTACSGAVLMIRVADCVPLILYDRNNGALALIHAGWRGTAEGIAAKTVRAMSKAFGSDPGALLAGIGPAIGPCCYAVGEEVARIFQPQCMPRDEVLLSRGGRTMLDLAQANRLQLLEAGCRGENIEAAGLCTSCASDIFFSHRREQGKTGRFAVIAGLRP